MANDKTEKNGVGAAGAAPTPKPTVDIFCPRHSYRRAGLAFREGWNAIEVDLLSAVQIAALTAETERGASGDANALRLRVGHKLPKAK